MHYYNFNIGDFIKDSAHLTLEEDAIYRRLIDLYYTTEKAIQLDIKLVARSIRAREHEETITLILEEFFTRTEKGFKQKRIDLELKKYRDKSLKAAKSANARWNKGSDSCERNANASKTHTEGNANHKPITNKQEPINSKPVTKEKIPYQLIADAYNEFFYSKVNNSSKCQTVSPKRKKAISKLWNHKPYQPTGKVSTNNIGYWQRYFEYSSNQAGLNGGKASKDFDWIADFDALMNFNKYVKNIEGGYA